jgi:hypothetical protein
VLTGDVGRRWGGRLRPAMRSHCGNQSLLGAHGLEESRNAFGHGDDYGGDWGGRGPFYRCQWIVGEAVRRMKRPATGCFFKAFNASVTNGEGKRRSSSPIFQKGRGEDEVAAPV